MKVIETFLSIQGEGVDSGLLTFFVRFSGCNLRCSYCDTKYAYAGGSEMNIEEIIKLIGKTKAKKICLTGGEPLLQKDLKELIKKLIELDYEVNIETNGSVKLPIWVKNKKICVSMDIKCPSSGMSDKMIYENLSVLKEKDVVKFIIGDRNDYDFAKKIIKKIKKANIIFNPVYGQCDLKKLVEDLIKDQLDNVRFGIQLHKIIWGPRKKGV